MDNTERNIRRTILSNGLTILTEKMNHIRSVAMGVWIGAGSRHELAEVNGISHFVEHMVFKGTKPGLRRLLRARWTRSAGIWMRLRARRRSAST